MVRRQLREVRLRRRVIHLLFPVGDREAPGALAELAWHRAARSMSRVARLRSQEAGGSQERSVPPNKAPLMSSIERLPLFTFGTLRRDHENHHYLRGYYDRVLPAILRDFRRIAHLMIGRSPGDFVDGELFFLTDSIYDQTLAGCDRLEDIPPGEIVGPEYRRLAVTVETEEGKFRAWAYVHPDTLASDD